MSTTLSQAKRRWAQHTRHVLSNEAIAASRKRKEWRMIGEGANAIPTLILGEDDFRLEFMTSAQGYIFARLNGAGKTYPPKY